jgi:hypothetical protein
MDNYLFRKDFINKTNENNFVLLIDFYIHVKVQEEKDGDPPRRNPLHLHHLSLLGPRYKLHNINLMSKCSQVSVD